jgi:hypothetical protein
MKLPRRNFLHLAAGAAALPVVPRFAWAQTYPSRPVRIIVPAPRWRRVRFRRPFDEPILVGAARLVIHRR